MVRVNPMNVEIAPTSQWRDANNYVFVSALPPTGCAWEFLRRNPDYQRAWCAFGSQADRSAGKNWDAAAWGLVHFESPERDARSANVFWHRNLSREVLLLDASKPEPLEKHPELSLDGMQCRMTVQSGQAGERHILFAEDGRSLQLEVHGHLPIETARLTTEMVWSPRLLAARAKALKRFADLVAEHRLRACLYPPDKRASRFSRLL
ncbi:MAG: transcriptional regulator domain-containing protein, partial [Bryobacteraceae bacterium]